MADVRVLRGLIEKVVTGVAVRSKMVLVPVSVSLASPDEQDAFVAPEIVPEVVAAKSTVTPVDHATGYDVTPPH